MIMKAPKEQEDIKYKGLTLYPNTKIGVDQNGNPVYSSLLIKAYIELKELKEQN